MIRTFARTIALSVCCLSILSLTACQSSKQAVTQPLQTPLTDLVIGVAPFTQPTQSIQLLAGYIPEQQQKVTQDTLYQLDDLFAEKMQATGRQVVRLPNSVLNGVMTQDSQGRRSALATWVKIAKEARVDILVVPQIIDWRARKGGSAGVVTPAAVMEDFFLIDARGEGQLIQRSHYAEEQKALTNNLLSLGSFLQRKGKWVTAEDLAGEGMARAIKEFGL